MAVQAERSAGQNPAYRPAGFSLSFGGTFQLACAELASNAPLGPSSRANGEGDSPRLSVCKLPPKVLSMLLELFQELCPRPSRCSDERQAGVPNSSPMSVTVPAGNGVSQTVHDE